MIKKYFGDKAFYRWVLAVAIPIIIQNGITNFVALLDNIMVGQVGTDPMSGVSTVNYLLFVFNLCIFGASSGAGIFTAQFHGTKDSQGIRYTFRFKVLICLLLTAIGISIFLLADTPLINLYLQGEGDAHSAAQVLAYGREYLAVMLWGLLPFALCNAYSSTLRETGETLVPMVGGIVAVLVNLGLNYVLIFGHMGLPAMGVRGAALATVISRYVELVVVAGWTHLHKDRNPYIRGAYHSPYIPGKLFRSICVKGMPLLINEFLWASGMAIMNQCYSTCGLEVVPAMNIASTLQQLGSVVFLSMGNSVGILMGQMLGAGHSEDQVRSANRKLITISVLSGSFFGGIMALFAGGFPQLYNTGDAVRTLAAQLIYVYAAIMPFSSYTNATYFTLRSGGQTLVTFLFDSCFVWCVCVPLAFCLSRFTSIPILPLFIICQSAELLKCTIGAFMLKKGAWIQNLTNI
ncbi:MAG: MATE family efflux transporter [Oscillospiraceae bacterium]|nr:MATE family efflux transporter [Oscillospiraceae bacterium]